MDQNESPTLPHGSHRSLYGMARAHILTRALLGIAVVGGVLSALGMTPPLFQTSPASPQGVPPHDGSAAHLTLDGGRMFECGPMSRSACLEAALAASIAEAALLRVALSKFQCADALSVSASGAFCVSAEQPVAGGNDYLDTGIVASLCADAGQGASVLDLGAGTGQYRGPYVECGLQWRGFDGAGNTEEATGGQVHWADLSVPIDVGKADWVQSLEVGEHLPERFTGVYIDNVIRHARRGVILSWAVPLQGGHHHVNNRPNEDVIADFALRGFVLDVERTRVFRAAASLKHFRNTLMIFVPTSSPTKRITRTSSL